jgi:hypothetical protein
MSIAAATLSTKFWKGRQSLEAEQIVTAGPWRLRARVCRDSYDQQSYVRLEVWTTEGWSHLTATPFEQTKVRRHSYVTRDTAAWHIDALADMGALLVEGVAFVEGLQPVPASAITGRNGVPA